MNETMALTLIRIAASYRTDKGCYVRIKSPDGRYIDTVHVKNVYDTGVFHGHSLDSDMETAYDVTDGIHVLFIENPSSIFQCRAYDTETCRMLSYRDIRQYALQDLLSGENLKLCPYTGMDDACGRQICQGDILSLAITDDILPEILLTVDTHTESFLKKHPADTMFICMERNITVLRTRYYLYFQKDRQWLTHCHSRKIFHTMENDTDILADICEIGATVTGNIYETPELCPILKT